MALDVYRAKRNFSATPEPKPTAPKEGKEGFSFVVQKHDARRLHYDFRLELDGVLKSWAVTRGPSLIPGEKRLAVETEDHPLEYGSFEGTIPKGEYGGGAVLVWDHGTWTPTGDPHKGLAKGHLDFELHGEKLKGRWHLVRMRRNPRDKHANWLLIKGDDEYARPEDAPDILEERPESAQTGRSIDDVAGEAPGWSSKTGRIEKKDDPPAKAKRAPAATAVDPAAVKKARKAPMPAFVEPMLATPAKAPGRRRALSARDQARRLSHRGARRKRAGPAVDPQRARLDGKVWRADRRRAEVAPHSASADRRRDHRRERGGRLGFLGAASGAQRRAD